jgi:hypothetical protein
MISSPRTPDVTHAHLAALGYTFLAFPPSPSPRLRTPKSAKRFNRRQAKSAATIAQSKRAKYPRPPPLANELALMQFADGGSVDSHVKRIMDAQARAATGQSTHTVGVSDVFRDAAGAIWWDQDEEWEYTHLLDDPSQSQSPSWVCFDTDGRRGSVSTIDSDLDARHIVRPSSDDDFAKGVPAPPKPKRRPTPLNLDMAYTTYRTLTRVDTGASRRDFIDASFAPPVPMRSRSIPKPVPIPVPSPATPGRRAVIMVKKTPPKKTVRQLFRGALNRKN